MIRLLLFVSVLLQSSFIANSQVSENDQVQAIVGSTPGLIFNGHFTTNPASQVGGTIDYTWQETDTRDDVATQALHRGLVKFTGTSTSYLDLNLLTGPKSCGQTLGLWGGDSTGTGDAKGVSFEMVAKFDAVSNWAKPFDFNTGPGIDEMTLTWDGDSDGIGRMLVEQYVNASRTSINFDKLTMEFFRPNLAEWYHLAIVIKPATEAGSAYWYLYVNGQQLGLAGALAPGAAATPLQTANYPLRIPRPNQWLARSAWSADPYMQMTLDAFRVYDYALAPQTIGRLANVYGLNKTSSQLPTPALNVVYPARTENTKHRTSSIDFDPFYRLDFAVDPTTYVGGTLGYQWLESDPADSAADRAKHTGLAKFTGTATSFIDMMKPSGPNSAGLVMPTLFGQSSGTGDANGWTIEMVVKPTGTFSSQRWSKYFCLGNGPYYDALYVGWLDQSNLWEAASYNNIRDDLKFANPGQATFFRAPTLNKWQHLAWVMQPVAQGSHPLTSYNATWSLYVNGQLVTRNTATASYPLPVVRRQSYLAASNWAADVNAQMVVDAFRVWDRALNANQVESLSDTYGVDPIDGGDWAWSQAIGTSRRPVYNLDFQANPTQNGGGATAWEWREQDPTDDTVIAGLHTGLAVLNGGATSYVDLDNIEGPNRVYDNLVMPQVGGLTSPGAGYVPGWSFEMVFKATGYANWAKLFTLGNNRDVDEIMVGFDGADGNMIVQNYIEDAVYNGAWAYAAVQVVKPTVLNKWYHIVVTMRPGVAPGSGNWQVYVNGQLQDWATRITQDMTFTELQGASFPRAVPRLNSYLGKSNWDDPNIRVVYDAFRIYDYVITPLQVAAFASAYGCFEIVPVFTPTDNKQLPDRPETTNWQVANLPRGPVFNGVFADNPAPYVGGVTDYKWLDVDPSDDPQTQARHKGLLVFNGSDACFADLTRPTGPKSVGLVMPLVGGAGNGQGEARGITFEMVVKLTAVETWAKLFQMSSGPDLDSTVIGWRDRFNTLEVHNFNSIRSGLTRVGSVDMLASPNLGQWYHLAVVMQLTDDQRYDGRWTLYVDGEITATKLSTDANNPANFPLPVYRQDTYLAKSAWNDATATMVLDEFRVFDYALSQAQVRASATQYGLYGSSKPVVPANNVTLAFPPTEESMAAALLVSKQPVFNAWFGTNPSTMVRSPNGFEYEYLDEDTTDSGVDRTKHRGLVRLSGAASSYIDVTTNFGPNSCGVVLPVVGGAGSGTGASRGWTFELVFKLKTMASWAKLFNFGNGPEINNILCGVDGTDSSTMNFEIFDTRQTAWPHGFAEVFKPSLNTWYHVVVLVSPVNMTAGSANWQFWVNGNLLNWSDGITKGMSFTAVQGANYPVAVPRQFSYIGKSNWNDPTFSGVVDAMRVYDYVLTPKEITDLATLYGCNEPSQAIQTPASNKPVNPSNQPEVNAWNRAGIPAPVFNANFAVDPRGVLGGLSSSYGYTWMASDPTDSVADQNLHKGLIVLNGSDTSFIDLMRSTGSNSIGLVLPTVFGQTSGSGNSRGWTIEMTFKNMRPDDFVDRQKWSKLWNLATGGGDWMESIAITWDGDMPRPGPTRWMVQNYLNLNPVSNQPKENFNLPLYNNPVRNKWYHVVLVVSPVGPNELFGAWWRVYVDGTRTNRTEMANMPLPVVRDNSYIGSSQWGLQDANSMMIVDSFRIYDQALSAQQIAALARDLNSNNPTVVPEPDLPPPAGGNGENPSGSSSSSSLGGGAIAGIVIGSVVGAAILCAIIFCFCLTGAHSKGSSKSFEESGPKNTSGYGEMEHSQQSHVTGDDEIEMGDTHA